MLITPDVKSNNFEQDIKLLKLLLPVHNYRATVEDGVAIIKYPANPEVPVKFTFIYSVDVLLEELLKEWPVTTKFSEDKVTKLVEVDTKIKIKSFDQVKDFNAYINKTLLQAYNDMVYFDDIGEVEGEIAKAYYRTLYTMLVVSFPGAEALEEWKWENLTISLGRGVDTSKGSHPIHPYV